MSTHGMNTTWFALFVPENVICGMENRDEHIGLKRSSET